MQNLKENFLSFLNEFDINDKIIKDYIFEKKFFENQYGVFLILDENFCLNKNNCIYQDEIIFINLKEKLPSKFLLNFIAKNTKNKFEITQKQALKFSYGKNLNIEDKKQKEIIKKLNQDKNILLISDNDIIGYGTIKKDNGKLIIENKFNIGKYLKEE